MITYIAFLRGINSGANPSQKMENLRKIFENLGLENVQSVIASGNIIFDTDSKSKGKLAETIEKAMLKGTGVESTTILRTAEELQDLITHDPFKKKTDLKPFVTFMKQKTKFRPDFLLKDNGYEIIKIFDDTVCYLIDPTATKTPNIMAMLEKELGKDITTRTWNTVQRVYKKLL
jgi:uncharacterized protein (DUF1697 family)